MGDFSRLEIIHAPQERWGSALNLVLSRRPFAERMQLAEGLARPQGNQPAGAGFQGLFEARLDDETVGAALAVLQPGRTALTYQPRVTDGAPPHTALLLQDAIARFLQHHDICLAQEVLPLDATADAAQAKLLGYSIEITLHYLAAEIIPIQSPLAPEPIGLAPYIHSDEPRLAGLLDRSFAQTLDCPEINGVRSPLESLRSYAQTGISGTTFWGILMHQSRDVGCVLVARHANGSAELVYLGIVPEARGRGWGRAAVDSAKRLAHSAGCEAISVAVDSRNTPAIRAYESSGFYQFDSRRVMLWVLTPEGAAKPKLSS